MNHSFCCATARFALAAAGAAAAVASAAAQIESTRKLPRILRLDPLVCVLVIRCCLFSMTKGQNWSLSEFSISLVNEWGYLDGSSNTQPIRIRSGLVSARPSA